MAGLTPTPHQSGELRHELGIAKAGNRRVRWMSIEGAWAWLRFQPQSALSKWYQERFGHGGPRMRKIGIVALARKLLIALWRFLETGVVPEGAELKTRISDLGLRREERNAELVRAARHCRRVRGSNRVLEGAARPEASPTPLRRTQDWVIGATRAATDRRSSRATSPTPTKPPALLSTWEPERCRIQSTLGLDSRPHIEGGPSGHPVTHAVGTRTQAGRSSCASPGRARPDPVRDLFLLVVAVEVPRRLSEGDVGPTAQNDPILLLRHRLHYGTSLFVERVPDMRPPTAIITSTTSLGSSSIRASQ